MTLTFKLSYNAWLLFKEASLKSFGFTKIHWLAVVIFYLMILPLFIYFLYQTFNESWDSQVGFSISTFYINMIKEGKYNCYRFHNVEKIIILVWIFISRHIYISSKDRKKVELSLPNDYRVSLAACHVFLEIKHDAFWQLSLPQRNSKHRPTHQFLFHYWLQVKVFKIQLYN